MPALLFFAPMLRPRLAKPMQDALLPAFRPLKFSRQNCETGWNDQESGSGQHQHGHSDQQYDAADYGDEYFLNPRFQLQQIGAKAVPRLEAPALIAASGTPC